MNMEEDTRSFVMHIPKPRKFSNISKIPEKKSVIPHFSRRTVSRPSVSSLKRYILPSEDTLPICKLKKTKILLPFKIYSKVQDKDRFMRRMAIKICEKYKIVSTDLKQRLYIDDPPDDVETVVDIDDNFYGCVNGRSVRDNDKIFKTLKILIRDLTNIKLEIGIRNDFIFNIETNHRNELDIFGVTLKRITDQAKYFDTFISEDYQKSKGLLAKWDRLKVQVELKSKELANLAVEKFTIMAKIIGLDYKFSLQQKYGRFLYYLSPPSWRFKHRDFARSIEIEAKGFDYGDSCDDDNFIVIFEKLQKLCVTPPVTPALYFSQPRDLIDVFEAMEEQQLHHFAHVNHVTPLTIILNNEIKTLEDTIVKDSSAVSAYIKKIKNTLSYSEERCKHLEAKFFKILYGFFYNSVGAPDTLKLKLCLEFCFEKVLFEKPTNMDLVALASSIEKLYMDYSKSLDTIRSSSVRRAITKCENMEHLKFRRAVNAAKELRLFHRLEKELLRSHGITPEKVYKPVKTGVTKSSSKYKCETNIEDEKNDILTEAEKEYLHLFTNWTENEDPGKYLHSFSSKDQGDICIKL